MSKKRYESEPKTCCVATVTSEKNLTLNNAFIFLLKFFLHICNAKEKKKKERKRKKKESRENNEPFITGYFKDSFLLSSNNILAHKSNASSDNHVTVQTA